MNICKITIHMKNMSRCNLIYGDMHSMLKNEI